jgi:multisubunit Na+/H+ antiporter MnhG subunit
VEISANRRIRRSELKRFGVTVGIAFAAFGVLFLIRGKSFYPYLLGAGAAFLLFGLLLPAALRPIHKVWMAAAFAMGWFMTRLILTVLFLAIVTPFALIGRVIRRDPLKLKFKDGADSYWVKKSEAMRARSDYERQF